MPVTRLLLEAEQVPAAAEVCNHPEAATAAAKSAELARRLST